LVGYSVEVNINLTMSNAPFCVTILRSPFNGKTGRNIELLHYEMGTASTSLDATMALAS
jgi:hypothetical protein